MYSLRKSTTVLRRVYRGYRQSRVKLSDAQKEQIRALLGHLQTAILNKDRPRAYDLALQAESFARTQFRRTPLQRGGGGLLALLCALVIAILVRQMWFEFYEIPSGSMRPTLREQDRVVVSKTDFGINLPLTPRHIYFNPSLVQRSSIFTFTGEAMDIPDVDTLYFYLFPGKKQYIKRLMGKPGDTLYFYGGQLYGIDSQGRDITQELQPSSLTSIDHIPFLHFEGKVSIPHYPVHGVYSPIVLSQMNEPICKLMLLPNNQIRGEMLPLAVRDARYPPLLDYGDLWGMKNFAMARLLSKEQVVHFTDQDPAEYGAGVLYLELKHDPSIRALKLLRDEADRLRPGLTIRTSLIPLDDAHLQRLARHLYTARFIVKGGVARRYGVSACTVDKNPYLPRLPDVPDGTYEFIDGTAYSVRWGGVTAPLPSDHPLYCFTPERLQLLFNVGMELDMRFAPQRKHQALVPARYAYFRHGALCVLGAPLLTPDDPLLLAFVQQEKEKQKTASVQTPYAPFIDHGPPLKTDGSLDVDFVRQYGLRLPAKSYLALGDNHAMSGDSRVFGFVPEGNLRGGPDFIFWPPGSRWGAPNQPPYPWFNAPRSMIWTLAGIGLLSWYLVHRRRHKLPIAIK
jgi:signal peptidase I